MFSYRLESKKMHCLQLMQQLIQKPVKSARTNDVFLTKGQFENGGGLVDNSLREAALAHELGHKFGVNYYDGVSILGYDKGNWNSDFEINGAINRLSRETVRKGYDWNRVKNNLIITTDMRDFWTKMSVYDKLRLGARRLSKA